MASTRQRPVFAAITVLVLAAGCSGGCNNDNFANHGVITAAPRFQLVVEEGPTPARLLLDSTTGDLWQLRSEGGAGTQWVRVANAPADSRVLTPQEVLGMRSPKTPAP